MTTSPNAADPARRERVKAWACFIADGLIRGTVLGVVWWWLLDQLRNS